MFKTKSILILLATFFLSQGSLAKVILIKQWHLAPKVKTNNIKESKKNPQFMNQKDIYLFLDKKIKSKEITHVISEGCEGEVDKNFSFVHNGWGYKKLKQKVKSTDYEDILALIPLKLEVKHGDNLRTICGDSLSLIMKNSLSFSELRGFASFTIALIQNKKKNPKKFELYKKTLFEDAKNPKNLDAITFAKQKASEHLNESLRLIKLRNDKFIEVIKKFKGKNIAVVIGGLHVDDLSKKLTKLKIANEVYTPKGYKNIELELLQTLNKFLK